MSVDTDGSGPLVNANAVGDDTASGADGVGTDIDAVSGLGTSFTLDDAATDTTIGETTPTLPDGTTVTVKAPVHIAGDRDSADATCHLADTTSNAQLIGGSTPYAPSISPIAWSAAAAAAPTPVAERPQPPVPVDFIPAPSFAAGPPDVAAAATPSGPVGAAAGVGAAIAIVNASGSDPVSDAADEVVQGDAARSTYDVDGTGIKIGIISDSFNSDHDAATDEADGALPPAADVDILQDASGTDEGRAMAEIAHSIAPGAQIDFYTAGNSDSDMATAISALQSAGCQIIIDDVFFTDEPFYQEGVISAAVNSVVAAGSTYFTAANNSSDSFYEGTFTPITATGPGGSKIVANNFGTAANPSIDEAVTIPQGLSTYIDLQWNQPYLTADGVASGPGSANSLAFKLLNSSGRVVAAGTDDDVGGDPIQAAFYTNNTSSTSFELVVYENESVGPTPGQFKIIIDNDSSEPPSLQNGGTGSGTVLGHEEDPNAITVGAAPEQAPTGMENYSAYGPGEFLFDANGNPLPAPVTDGKINVVAPDGNSTSVPGLTSFYGTSAATPAAAAVGALMLEANTALDPSDVENILEDTGTPIAGNPDQTGSGMVDALAAVGASETLTFDESASVATLLGTHLGATFVGGSGSHTLVGEGGVTTLDYEDAPAAVTVNFVTDTASNGFGGTDSFTDIQAADGSVHNDSFIAGSTGETLFGDGGNDSLNFAALAAGGVLNLTGGNFSANTASSGNDAGTIDVEDACTLDIAGGTLVDTGLLEVQSGGDLDLACALSGSGAASVGSGSILELGSTDSTTIEFTGTPAMLKLDAPASFSGKMTGLALGDVLDLVGTSVTATKLGGSTLSITLSGGSTLTYQVAGALSNDYFAITSDGSTGSDLILTALPADGLAQATINTTSPISLGATRVGGTLSQALSIGNSATPPAEALDASIGSTTGSATGTGTISLLAAGGTDPSDIVVGVTTASAGASTGSVTVAFSSDGSTTDGNGKTALASQTVQVSGAVYREAAASVGGLPANFIVHVGSTVAQALTVTNSAAADGYSENLIATVVSSTGGLTASGATGDIAAQGSSGAISLGFSTAQAGTVSGSVTLGLSSDGTGLDGFGPTSTGQQVVAVNATVDNYAVAALEEVSGGGVWTQSGTSYTLSLGTLAEGASPVTIALGALNDVTGPSDLLSGSFTSSGGSAFTQSGFGAFAGLGAGQADLAPSVTLSTGTAGSFSETITLDPTGSNASGYTAALAPETLTITGTVAGKAQATINTTSPIALGATRIGGTLSQALSIGNSATPPAEALDASIGSTTGNATGTGTINLLAAGGTDPSDIVVGVTTASAGGSTGSVTVAFSSDGSTTDGNGKTALASQTVQVSGAVYREAAASVGGLPANFIVHVGSTVAQALTVTNSAAADGYSENLIATVVSSTGGLTASGSTGDIAAQGSSGAISLGFSTAQAGTVSGSVTLGLSSDGTGLDGFGPTSIGTKTVTVKATVDNYAVATIVKLSSAGTLTKSGTSYTLNIGNVTLGSAPDIIDLGIRNTATGSADLLSGSFTSTSSSAFSLSGFGNFSGLAAGQADTQPSVTFSTGTAGAFTETITLDPVGSNASGYSGALTAETLTISGTVVGSMSWAGPSSTNRSGTWNTAQDWSPTLVPTNDTKAVISLVGTYTVTSTQSNSVGALTLSNGSATLAVGDGTFAILGSSTDAGTIAVSDGATLQLTGTMTDTGRIALNSTGDATDLMVAGAATITGTGSVALDASAANAIVSNGATATLTNKSTIAGSGSIGDIFLTLVNAAGATINGSGGTNALTLAGTVTNSGLIEATGSAGLIVSSTIAGAAGVISAVGATVYLDGAVLDGGTLQSSAGGQIETSGGANTLSQVTSTGSVVVSDGTSLTLEGTVTNNGTITLNSTGDPTALDIAGTMTLQGSGQVAMAGPGFDAIQSNGAAATLTNKTTISGSGTIGDAFLALVNGVGGTIDGSSATSALTLGGAHAITNAGLIEATGSAGVIVATTISNSTGGVIAAAGANIYLDGAVVSGGTLQSSAGGQIEISGGANTLSALTSTGSIVVGDGTVLTLKGIVTNNGTIALDSTGDATSLELASTVTLQGSGQVTLGSGSGDAILSTGTPATLVNAETIAGAGTIGDSHFALTNAAAGVIDANGSGALTVATTAHAITNSGLMEATGSGGLALSNALVNNGTLAASGGALSVTGAVSGTGQATIAGATLSFGGQVASTQSVTFAVGSAGTLALGLAQSFAGTVAGLATGDTIDLKNFQFSGKPSVTGVAAITQSGSTIGEAVTVKDGSFSATVDLLNQFGAQMPASAAGYVLATDATGAHPGTLLELAPPAAA